MHLTKDIATEASELSANYFSFLPLLVNNVKFNSAIVTYKGRVSISLTSLSGLFRDVKSTLALAVGKWLPLNLVR